MKRWFAPACLFLCSLTLLPAQTTTPPSSTPATPPAGSTPAAPAKPAPEPYRPEEFPEWARQLRRAEIIAIGIFPFMALGVSLGSDLGRYSLSGFKPQYAPGPFRQPGGPVLSTQEQIVQLGISFGFSLLAAGIDFLLGQAEKPEAAPAEGP